MSGVVSRFVKASLAVYDPICKAFGMDDLQGLRVAIETGSEQLMKVCIYACVNCFVFVLCPDGCFFLLVVLIEGVCLLLFLGEINLQTTIDSLSFYLLLWLYRTFFSVIGWQPRSGPTCPEFTDQPPVTPPQQHLPLIVPD